MEPLWIFGGGFIAGWLTLFALSRMVRFERRAKRPKRVPLSALRFDDSMGDGPSVVFRHDRR